ncbi:MAG: hypothetical protein ISS50_07935 [Anaerolineae bacterium]|nr:hypothetical protein [Anaerolineae bacterium]
MAASSDELDLAPYAGRWIAIVRGRVAGVGLSPEEARRLAKRNRPREEPVIVFVSGEGEPGVPLEQDSPNPSEGKQ